MGLLVVLALVVGPTQKVSIEQGRADSEPSVPIVETLAAEAAAPSELAGSELPSGDRADPADPETEERDSEDGLIAASEPAPLFWEVSGDSPYLFDYPIGDYRPERHALRLAPSVSAGLGVGDRISLPVPGLGTLVATVEHVETTPLGNRGISGSIEGMDDAYAITLTEGHSSIFGRITTPDGNYMIEGTGGAAAIFKDDLDKLIDPESVDEVYPPESPEEQV